ncbi:sensor histidine kinase [Streptomyces lasiicapitis]|uniref:histidine kinase n=2 Tax=Streptomyces lasiicapitis TaxID=1923961 RepID=A0ABQ2LXR6_9ACTN|nr:histidine kinase [Streptomyces lasiicapitis]GGO44112.1 two-component sensor histidine kinase [Streptomyces lasiicapitis]
MDAPATRAGEGGADDVPYPPSDSRPWWPFSGAVPGTPRAFRQDALLAAHLAGLAVVLTFLVKDGRTPDALGWALLVGAHVPLIWRRSRPMTAMLATMALVGPYHALDYTHAAATHVGMVALYSVAVSGRPRRALLTGLHIIAIMFVVNSGIGRDPATEVVRIAGWIVAVLIFGTYVRVHRQYVDSVVERAERAERTREEEARRRVAEERLRVARDLHDLLAHSITLVGVQTSVAAHVLAADPERLDRAAIAGALDDIADTCRTARGELRATLEVLRTSSAGDGPGAPGAADEYRGPLPGLDGIGDLADAARTAGAKVDLAVRPPDPAAPPAVGAAAYRIVQEALTNAVRHGGPGLSVAVRIEEAAGELRVTVRDDGVGVASAVSAAVPPARAGKAVSAPAGAGSAAAGDASGFGLVGMRERVRIVGGTLEAGPRADGARGFEVAAALPLGRGREEQESLEEGDG